MANSPTSVTPSPDCNSNSHIVMSKSESKLFQPIRVGPITLNHRVVYAPTTRYRADDNHVPRPYVKEYYQQRSSVPGTLLITEATFIAQEAGLYANAPGIWSQEQISAWKEITDAVHANGSYIFLQLWALGRAADPDQLRKEGKGRLRYVGVSSIKHGDHPNEDIHVLTTSEIKSYIPLYATAASNAVHLAGFDGVEIHGANGYLIDQFIQDVTNDRTDDYGGSIENRARFALEVTDAVVKAVGAERTAIRFSPWGTYNYMGMTDPVPTFSHVVRRLKEAHPNLAYLHLVEPRSDARWDESKLSVEWSNDFIRKIWNGRPLITAGGYTRQIAIETAEKKGDIIAFSRLFIANPDLPYRLKYSLPLTVGDRSTYYGGLGKEGYIDYPFYSAQQGC